MSPQPDTMFEIDERDTIWRSASTDFCRIFSPLNNLPWISKLPFWVHKHFHRYPVWLSSLKRKEPSSLLQQCPCSCYKIKGHRGFLICRTALVDCFWLAVEALPTFTGLESGIHTVRAFFGKNCLSKLIIEGRREGKRRKEDREVHLQLVLEYSFSYKSQNSVETVFWLVTLLRMRKPSAWYSYKDIMKVWWMRQQ